MLQGGTLFFQKEGKFISRFVCVVLFWFFCWVHKLGLWSEIVVYGFDKHPPHAEFLSVCMAPLTLPLSAAKFCFENCLTGLCRPYLICSISSQHSHVHVDK